LQLCRRTDHVETWSPPYVGPHSSLDLVIVTVRVCTTAGEERRSLEIYNEVWPRHAVTSEDVEAWKRSSIADVEFLGATEGVEAGSAAAAVQTSRPTIASVFVTVLPHLRRRGVGSALLEAASAWAVDHGARELETPVESDDEESLGFALRRGFVVHSRELGLELQLARTDPSPVEPPRGIEIALLGERPDLARGAYDVGVEALPDIPGGEDWTPPPFAQFLATHLRGLAVFLAIADGEVVGYAKLQARPDGRTAEHGMTAVKRAWRGRGIAKALKRAQIAWAQANGIERLTTSNEERNAPMQRVNASLGYRATPGRLQLRRLVV
jgi:GNAT superfamily N-acetyltransferase